MPNTPITNYFTPGVYVTQSGTSLASVSNANINIAIVADQPTPGTSTDTFYGVVPASGLNIGQLTTPMVNTTSTGTYSNYAGYTVTWVNSLGVTVTGTYGTNFTVSTPSGSPFSYLTTSGTAANTNLVTVTGNGTQWVFNTTTTNNIVAGSLVTITAVTGTVAFASGTYTVASANSSAFYINNTTNGGIGSTTITGTATQNVVPSGTVGISYGHNWGAYGKFPNFNALTTAIGPAVSGTTIVNPAVLAAQLAFQNGASNVSIMPVARISTSNTGPAQLSDWTRTFTASSGINSDPTYLMSLTGVDVIVPLYGFVSTSGATNGQIIPYGAGTLASGINTYLNNQFSYGTMQRAFIGVDGTANQVTSTALASLAQSFYSKRISLVYPAVVNYNPGFNAVTGLSTTSFNIPGYYMAAAIAGVFANQPTVATPITNKTVAGFSSIPNQISEIDASTNYLPYGITTVRQKRDGNFWILQGLTTDTTSWVSQEISINAIGDLLTRNVRTDLVNSQLVGGPLTNVTSAAVLGTVQATLTNALSDGLIQSYQNLSLSLNPATPTTVNVTFQYAPTYPINYIQVSLSLNTQTGTVVAQNAQSNFVVY